VTHYESGESLAGPIGVRVKLARAVPVKISGVSAGRLLQFAQDFGFDLKIGREN